MNRQQYLARKEAAKFRSTKPTKTDQGAARDTDINVIMRQYNVTGFIRGGSTPPTFGDYTAMRDLKTTLDIQRNLRQYHASLPEQLRALPLSRLLDLKVEDVQRIMQPPEQPGDKPNSET